MKFVTVYTGCPQIIVELEEVDSITYFDEAGIYVGSDAKGKYYIVDGILVQIKM